MNLSKNLFNLQGLKLRFFEELRIPLVIPSFLFSLLPNNYDCQNPSTNPSTPSLPFIFLSYKAHSKDVELKALGENWWDQLGIKSTSLDHHDRDHNQSTESKKLCSKNSFLVWILKARLKMLIERDFFLSQFDNFDLQSFIIELEYCTPEVGFQNYPTNF